MEKQRLIETLTELRTQLADAPGADPETLARLDALLDEAHRGNLADDAVEPIEDFDPLGLKDLLLKFEAEHPQLSASIGRVADALAAMGF